MSYVSLDDFLRSFLFLIIYYFRLHCIDLHCIQAIHASMHMRRFWFVGVLGSRLAVVVLLGFGSKAFRQHHSNVPTRKDLGERN